MATVSKSPKTGAPDSFFVATLVFRRAPGGQFPPSRLRVARSAGRYAEKVGYKDKARPGARSPAATLRAGGANVARKTLVGNSASFVLALPPQLAHDDDQRGDCQEWQHEPARPR